MGEITENYHVVYERERNVKFNCGPDVLKTVTRDPSEGCRGCNFADENAKCAIRESAREFVGRCEAILRSDRCNVKFIKVGESI